MRKKKKESVEQEREILSSLYDLWSSGRRSSSDREVKSVHATRAMRGYQNNKFLPRSKVRVFTETEKRRCPGQSRYLRYGFSHTRFNFCLRACVCVSKGGAVQFSPLTS